MHSCRPFWYKTCWAASLGRYVSTDTTPWSWGSTSYWWASRTTSAHKPYRCCCAGLYSHHKPLNIGECSLVQKQEQNMIYVALMKAFSYLHKEDVSCCISASMNNKCLFLDVTTSTGPDGQLTTILHRIGKNQLQKTKKGQIKKVDDIFTIWASLSSISLISWLYVSPMWDLPIKRLTFFLMSFLFT